MRNFRLRQWAANLKSNTHALYLASSDPRVPCRAKLIIAIVVAYALSPIDLIPDFIPVIGYLDDLLLVPLGIWLAMKLVPSNVWQDCQRRAQLQSVTPGKRRWVAVIIILIWLSILTFLAGWVWKLLADNP